MLLPLLPTAPGDPSPYATQSAFGLNPLFIDLARLPDRVIFQLNDTHPVIAVPEFVRVLVSVPLSPLVEAAATFQLELLTRRELRFVMDRLFASSLLRYGALAFPQSGAAGALHVLLPGSPTITACPG